MTVTARYLCCLLLILCTITSHARDMLPAFVRYTEAEASVRQLTWTDRQGVHYLEMETSDIITGEEPDTRSQWVSIRHYIDTDGRRRLTWSCQAGEYDCPLDVRAIFRTVPHFSDLNGDGVYELWFMVQKFCRGDISPSQLVIIMVDEKGRQYILEGETLQTFPDGTTDGGAHKLNDFKQLPRTYQDYAVEYFHRNKTESIIEK